MPVIAPTTARRDDTTLAVADAICVILLHGISIADSHSHSHAPTKVKLSIEISAIAVVIFVLPRVFIPAFVLPSISGRKPPDHLDSSFRSRYSPFQAIMTHDKVLMCAETPSSAFATAPTSPPPYELLSPTPASELPAATPTSSVSELQDSNIVQRPHELPVALVSSRSDLPSDLSPQYQSEPSSIKHSKIEPDSTVTGSSLAHTHVMKSQVSNSTIKHGTIQASSVSEASTLKHCNLTQSQVSKSSLAHVKVEESVIQGATLAHCTVHKSTIVGGTYKHMVIRDQHVVNGNFMGKKS
ncbi:hypothetical protein EJ05DRAFT_497875 [Pseudovirgaria hyperparasitica]|uniref:Uncharacterized protein n=1 Tax=Pseudovirgaria hyperparasitica TaxID=470096 RepID=A0A6A6WF23_9PEZI|nr:uncharacterized protein EJ05DRAFT_497875 [Pseudovirgaria hyperparasitica]KAF2761323.1 hypothetical protein EJ05DRAFT_497875 [Pseudovirgaria hyperparasitica]